MEENEVMNTEVTEEMMEIIPDQTTESKPGLTTGQKAIGLGVIGFAIYGIYNLVKLVIKGVKKVVSKVKAKKAAKEEIENAEVIEVDMTSEEIQNASTEE